MTDEDKPALVKMGANTREPAEKVNLDVSGTTGPDYLGQQTTDVPGHPADRPGVRSRLPENATPHTHPDTGEEFYGPEIQRMDTGEELPVLLSSSMKTGPIEGTQGSYTEIREGCCARCGYDRIKVTVATMAGERQESCMACGAVQGRRYDDGYRMPKTGRQRARETRESGEKIGTTRFKGDVIDDSERAVYLVDSRSRTRIPKEDVETLFWLLVDNDDIDLAESIRSRRRRLERFVLATNLLPDNWAPRKTDVEEEEEEEEDE